MELPWIDGEHPCFPPPCEALTDPDGLLAVGGSLSTETLLTAYCQGIFPWYEVPQPILWWSPSERAILVPGEQHASRSLRKKIRQGGFEISTNRAFDAVVYGCAAPRAKARGTWITPQMRKAYAELHRLGHAHSVEYWIDGKLSGGLYGVQIGGAFCGESMFSHSTDASKIAFTALSLTLKNAGFKVIDCQLENPHLTSLGVKITSRDNFLKLLESAVNLPLHWPETTAFRYALSEL